MGLSWRPEGGKRDLPWGLRLGGEIGPHLGLGVEDETQPCSEGRNGTNLALPWRV